MHPFVTAQKFWASREGSRNSGLLWQRLLRLRLLETRVEFHQPRSQDVKRRDLEFHPGMNSSRNEITKMFCVVYSYEGRADLSKGD